MAPIQLPAALQDTADTSRAIEILRNYYRPGDGGLFFEGSLFDTWPGTTPEGSSPGPFNADDIVAVSLLGVHVPPSAAIALLQTQSEEFALLLSQLVNEPLALHSEPWPDDWAGWRLWQGVTKLDGMGPTTSSKLIARKLPLLRPVYDSVAAKVYGTENVWDGVRQSFQADPGLWTRLEDLRGEADLDSRISPLRILDVLAWMEGSGTAKAASRS